VLLLLLLSLSSLCQVMLYAEGFSGAKDLASKMVSLFLLSRQLLSQQQVRPNMSRSLFAAASQLVCTSAVVVTAFVCVHVSHWRFRGTHSTTTGVFEP
jgi:hypothetical protein